MTSFVDMPPGSRGAAGGDEAVFALPGGHLAPDGALHTEARLAPLNGFDEEFLGRLPADVCSAAAVTALLGRCLVRVGAAESAGEELARSLLVGDREYLLLKLREMTFGPRVAAVLNCRDCGAPMDVAFELGEGGVERRPVRSRFFRAELSPEAAFLDPSGVERREVEFRLPTGADQEAAAAAASGGEGAALEMLLARLVRPAGGDGGEGGESWDAFAARLPAATRAEIEGHMARVAPAVELELEGVCPECGAAFETTFDLTGFFAAEMQQNLRSLERAVHMLAFHYHWPEGEILSLTRRRRQRYVEMIEEELSR